jgi:hypothetical protein
LRSHADADADDNIADIADSHADGTADRCDTI